MYIYKQICRYMKIFEKGGLGIWTFMTFSVLHGIQSGNKNEHTHTHTHTHTRFCKVEIVWLHVIDFVDRILSAFSFPIFRQDATRQGPFGIGGHR